MNSDLENKIVYANLVLKKYYIELNYPKTSINDEDVRIPSLFALPKDIKRIFNSPFRISLDNSHEYLKFYISSINYNNFNYNEYSLFNLELSRIINDINILNNLKLPRYMYGFITSDEKIKKI